MMCQRMRRRRSALRKSNSVSRDDDKPSGSSIGRPSSVGIRFCNVMIAFAMLLGYLAGAVLSSELVSHDDVRSELEANTNPEDVVTVILSRNIRIPILIHISAVHADIGVH